MSVSTSYRKEPYAGSVPDPDSSVHDLLNNATEWLQYARGLTCLLADLVHEAESVDCHQMAIGLEAIGAMTRMGATCAAEAHSRLTWRDASQGATPVS